MGRSSAGGRVARALALAPSLGLAALLAAAAAAEGLYLHSIPTTSADPASLSLERPLRVRLVVADPEALAQRLPGVVRSVGEDHLEIDVASHPQIAAGTPDAYRGASFLIDYEEPEVAALHEALVARHGAEPSLEALLAFASEAIPTKSMDRGWDLASRVARAGEGDCTEHAVLVTALARSVGLPARVVTGVLLAKDGGDVQALGHAWSEIHTGGRWVVGDATPIAGEVDAVTYLPLMAVQDEGPGYGLHLGLSMQRTWVRSVEVGPGDGPPPVPTAAP